MNLPEILLPLPSKEINRELKPTVRRVLLFNPAEIYSNVASELNHNIRIQSIPVCVFFPTIQGVCACGCGTVLEGRRTRWGGEDCSEFANDVRAIICGYPHIVAHYIRLYHGHSCINGCNGYDVEIDHIIPVKLGGGGCWLSNYQPLCKKCHKAKTNMDFGWKRTNQTQLFNNAVQ